MSLDEFREAGSFLDDEEESASSTPAAPVTEAKPAAKKRRSTPKRSGGHFLGITPAQRFILAAMLFSMVCLFGFFVMVLTERMLPPGLY